MKRSGFPTRKLGRKKKDEQKFGGFCLFDVICKRENRTAFNLDNLCHACQVLRECSWQRDMQD